jgi:hypothetical protein
MISFGRTFIAFLLGVSLLFTGFGDAMGAPQKKQVVSSSPMKACMVAAKKLGKTCCCCSTEAKAKGKASLKQDCGCVITPSPVKENPVVAPLTKSPFVSVLPSCSTPSVLLPLLGETVVLSLFATTTNLPNAPPMAESPPRAPPH